MFHKEIRINHNAASNSMNTCRILIIVLMTASLFVLSTGVGAAEDVNVTLDHTFSKISGEIENNDVLNLGKGYEIRITDIDKDVFPNKIRLILEKDGVDIGDQILETGHEYFWRNDEDSIKLNVEVFVGTSMDVVFFKNVYQIADGNAIIDNENFTTIYSDRNSRSLISNTADYNNIEGFTKSNENVLQSSIIPPPFGYSQEFLKEDYSLTLLELSIEGNAALISLSKNGDEITTDVLQVGDLYNYNSLLSFKLDKVFVGTSNNYIEISNIYQYSEIDSSVIVQNESALIRAGSTGKFIITGGGPEWQLEENYKLHVIDIDITGHSREAILLVTKDGTQVDYTIISVSDSYTYHKNGTPIITADLETIFSGEGGVSMARLYHVYQYSEDTGKILLNDAIHLYSVGNTREVEWQLNQNYSLSAMDIDSKDTPRKVWLRLIKDGNTLEDKIVYSGDSAIFHDGGTKILDLNVGTIFDGKESDLVFISDVNQYSETNKKDTLIENEQHCFIFGYAKGNDWQLIENYTLSFMDIDIKEYPNQVWFRMKMNGVPVDDNLVAQNEEYKYYGNSTLLFEGTIKSAFGGRYLDLLTITNANQYSEFDSTPLIVDATYSFYPENVEIVMDTNERISLDENYTLVPVDVQVLDYPNSMYYNTNESLWLRLYKDNVVVDEVILFEGQYYSYYNGSINIISTKLDVIFMGMSTELIKFEDLYQYSEVDGSLLNYYGDILLRLGSHSPPGAPVITSFEPTTLISDDVGATRKFIIFLDQSVNVNWYLNGTEIQLNESVANAEYTNTSASAGTWIISAIANNANGIAKQNWTWTVMAESEFPVHNINTGEDFRTIQAAIDYASPGDEIHVDSGMYYENVVVNKQLILLGEGNLTTTIDGNGSENVVEVTANEVVIEGFNIQNGLVGIYVKSNYNTLIGNSALNNSIGIYLNSSSYNTLYQNDLFDNTDYNAYDYNGINQWDWGTTGNYYSDYIGTDSNGDGIGDTPYNISGGSGAQDRYPLMRPCNDGESGNGSGIEYISIGTANVPTNSTITVPISVANVTDISGIYLDLLYNSSVATISSVSTNEGFVGSGINSNIDNANGITSIVLTNSNHISTPVETPVIYVTFTVTGGSGSSTSLNLQNVEFSDVEFNPYTPAVVVDGQITVGIKGDFNGNGIVDIGDVRMVAFMVAGNVPEDLNADFNGNGRVDIGDAAKIAFYLDGKVSEL